MKVRVREVASKKTSSSKEESGHKTKRKDRPKGPVRERRADKISPKDIKDDSSSDEEEELSLAMRYSMGNYGNDNTHSDSGRLKYVDPRSIEVKKWDPTGMPPDSFVIEFGKRRTGKSFLTRDIFYHLRHLYWFVTVHTKTKNNGFFQQFMNSDYIIKGFSEDGLQGLLDVQDMLKDKKLEGEIPQEAPIYAMVWLDDVVADDTLKYSEPLREAAVAGRHYDLLVGVNTQHVTGIPPMIRVNADVVVIFSQNNWKYKEKLAQEYLGMLNKQTAMELMDLYTEDHGCLVIEPWRNKTKAEECVFWYRADEPPKFDVHKPVPQYIEDELQDARNKSEDDGGLLDE
jgi:hypothetical protein